MTWQRDYSCTNCCAKKSETPGQWWGLSNYFGVSGSFCPACYELVSHDPYKNPRHPEAHAAIVAKQAKGRA